jgi:hypothetical protein
MSQRAKSGRDLIVEVKASMRTRMIRNDLELRWSRAL